VTRTWLFQANPSRFDIDGYLATKPSVTTFLVTSHHDEIAVGDRVFVWRAIGGGGADAAGIVAEAEVLEPVASIPENEPEARHFWTSSAEADLVADRVVLRLLRIAGKREVIRRRWVQEDPVLQDMLILRRPIGTNFRVSPEQATRLDALWSRTGRGWSYAESVAGLWTYYRTYGGELIRAPGYPIAEAALLLGRPVSGIFNKLMNFRTLDPREQREGMMGAGPTDLQVWAEYYDETRREIDVQRLKAEYDRLWDGGGPKPIFDTEDGSEAIEAEARAFLSLDLESLMARYNAIANSRHAKPSTRFATTRTFARDSLITAIAKVRAHFACEIAGCSHPTFTDQRDQQYCEVHHIRPLTEGGTDEPSNVACLCPAHHREVHYGKAATPLQSGLVALRSSSSN
jgi:hypothetical protein